ncbi:toll/interleukin-1 receptor domain-containing protein [Amycolatopsis sp. PS_44_ISF1]|uniref:toll/interleukin-1 receptor domain-containing protein n=1 Tax=Amycolatopsis sp. PS_44_ISF1 TaxID=2974917 RepID=UPI0028DE0176|nr:toll/interleukin-1 receptor domain-containing protein [Amycolatopsis sp. PS_44_ISF1]MDT8915440.1 toll/interleukin-1 receptor domain-containing protein [Amycolatopsis sp. PS_44_ISF1]
MPEIFVNYRTGDGQDLATIVDRDLRGRFGAEHVFMDHRSIPAGGRFENALIGGVWGSKVLLCVIGPTWFTAADTEGRRKIDDPQDWIHHELHLAFENGVHVIPILDERAESPIRVDELPKRLARLASCQYRTYRHRESDSALDRIARDILDLVPGLVDSRQQPPRTTDSPSSGTHVQGSGIGGIWGGGRIGPVITGPGDQYHGDVFGGSKFLGPANTGSGTFNNADRITMNDKRTVSSADNSYPEEPRSSREAGEEENR